MTNDLRVAVRDEKHWHELRAKNVGASDVAALFDASPYQSRFELWHRKKAAAEGSPMESSPDSQQMFMGRELEPAIARAAAKSFGWQLISCAGQYYQHPTVEGMGCTPDSLIIDPQHESAVGLLEIKNVNYMEFKRSWVHDEPPLHYILQLQHQLACTGLAYGYIVALVGGNELKPYFYQRDEKAIKKLCGAVADFWQSVRDGKEPNITAEADLEIVKAMYRPEGETEQDLSGDNELPELIDRYLKAKADRLALEKQEAQLQAEVIKKVGNHTFTLAKGHRISYKKITRQNKAREASTSEFYQLTIKGTENHE